MTLQCTTLQSWISARHVLMAGLAGAGRRLSKVIEQDVLVEDFSLDDIQLDDNDDEDYAAAGVSFF